MEKKKKKIPIPIKQNAYSQTNKQTYIEFHCLFFPNSKFQIFFSLNNRNRALRAINRSLGRGPDALPPISPFKMIPKIVSSCPELMLSDEVCDLLRTSPALQSVHSLIGSKTFRTWGGQIALRYPGDLCIPSEKLKQYDGPIGQFFVKKGLESMQAYQRSTAGAAFVNPDFSDEEFVPIPTW